MDGAMSGPIKLRLENIGKRFEVAGGAHTIAVQDFTLDVAQGEFLVVVGPSGCGKSTTSCPRAEPYRSMAGRLRARAQSAA